MKVDSYLELYSTMFGWMFYGTIWDVLVGTGIVFLPFLGIVIDNWREPATETSHAISSGISLRKMEHELLIALIVVIFAAQPMHLTPFVASTLSYTPPPTKGNLNPVTVNFGTAESSFGDTGFAGAIDTIDVPMWWYAVLAFSSGFNHAVVEGLPRASEIRHLTQLARLTTIEDRRIRQEVAEFSTSCYIPARSKYLRERPTSSSIESNLKRYGEADTDWLGSHVYRDTPGYYASLRARKPIEGWPYVAVRDTEYDPANPPTYGRPYCDVWWELSNRGLRAKLVAAADKSAAGFATLFYNLAPGLATERRLDLVARTTLLHTPDTWTDNNIAQNNTFTNGLSGHIENKLKGLAYSFSAVGVGLVFSVIVTGVISAAPMIQAVVLMGIYSLLPLVIVFSRYSLSGMLLIAIAIFGVKFWTVLWYLAQWIDQNLITAMYPDFDLLYEFITNSGEQTTKRVVLNIVTTCLYLGLPILWSAMLGWAGIAAAQSLNAVMNPFSRHTDPTSRRVNLVPRPF